MRDLIMRNLYEITKKPYQRFFKKGIPWNITPSELIGYKKDSLGFHLGSFLIQNNFEIQPMLEDHDIIHVLTNTQVAVVDEVGMQYFLLGNGKRSLYMGMVLAIGTLFYPDQTKHFVKNYKRGKRAHKMHDLDFQKMLTLPIKEIQMKFNIQ